MSFEIFLRETDVHAASLNTLLYCAASCSSHEVPCRFIQTNDVYKKGTDTIMIQSLSGEIAFTRHPIAAALIL